MSATEGPKWSKREEIEELKRGQRRLEKQLGELIQGLPGFLHSATYEEAPLCAKRLVRSEDVFIPRKNIVVKDDGTVVIKHAELSKAVRAVEDHEEGACNVIIQFYLRRSDVAGAFGSGSFDDTQQLPVPSRVDDLGEDEVMHVLPSTAAPPPPLVSVCSD